MPAEAAPGGRRRQLRVVIRAAAGTGVAVVALIVALWAFQRSLIYLPDRSAPPPAADVVPGARDVTVRTVDGLELGAWYVPASDRCAPTVLAAPGNAGNRADRAALISSLSAAGYGALLLDYRGYGGNAGRPSEQGLAADVRAARRFLLDEAGVPAGSLVYLGQSLGTGVVTELAAEHPPAALVLVSPFTSLADAADAAYRMPVGRLVRDRYPVADTVARLDLPVAVLYGTDDDVVPAEQSRAVARAAARSGAVVVERAVPGAGHDDAALSHGEALLGALEDVVRGSTADRCAPGPHLDDVATGMARGDDAGVFPQYLSEGFGATMPAARRAGRAQAELEGCYRRFESNP